MRYITAVLFSSIATAIVIFYAIPLYQGGGMIMGTEKGIVQLRAERKAASELIEKTKSAAEQINRLKSDYRRLRPEDISAVASMVPSAIDPVQLSYDIYRLGAKYGVSLANPTITKAGKDDKAPFQKYTVAISFETNYESALGLVHDIEYSLQLRDINSLSIVPAEGGVRTKVSLDFTTYAQK